MENIEYDERVLFVVTVRPLEADLRPQRMVVAKVCKEKRERQKGDFIDSFTNRKCPFRLFLLIP